MKYVLTNEQMREADAFTIETLGVPALELMERAGTALKAEAERLAPTGKILCVCGAGNNGGDGFVCGRLLLNAGREVDAVLFGGLILGAKIDYAKDSKRRQNIANSPKERAFSGLRGFFSFHN